MKPDVVGKWKALTCTLELRADGTFRSEYDSPRPDDPGVYGGNYQVTFDSPWSRGRWKSATGYFLQLDHVCGGEERQLWFPTIFQIESCDEHVLVMGTPRHDGPEIYRWLRVKEPTN